MSAKRVVLLIVNLACLLWSACILAFVYRQPDEMIVRVNTQRERYDEMINVLAADPLITNYGSYLREDDVLIQDGHLRRYAMAAAIHVWEDYLTPYPARMIRGEFIRPGDQASVVLSAKQASNLFASYDCLGRVVRMGENSYTVKGVYERRGIAALFSRMGEDEAYFSNGDPAGNWLIRIQPGKGDQKEYSLIEKLEGMGIRNLSISPLFRTKRLILFMAALQGYILLIVLLKRASSYRIGVPYSMMQALRNIGWLILPVLIIQYLPINPMWIPMNLTWAVVKSKAEELLIMSNNVKSLPTMETTQWAWVMRETTVAFLFFWLSLRQLFRKGRDANA